MRTLFFVVFVVFVVLVACGGPPPVPAPSCEVPAHEAPCCELAETRCVGNQAWVCEQRQPCTDAEGAANGGTCPITDAGVPTHPEFSETLVWYENGDCH